MNNLARISRLLGLIACLIILVPGAYSIGVGFSAGNGGESVGLWSSYDVGTDVAVREVSKASFEKLAIENARSISGNGDINALQSYSGSSGYAGSATLYSQDVSGSFQGSALLTPEYLSARQDLSLSGGLVDTSMSLAYEGDSADLGVAIYSGSIDSSQSIETGSVNNEILANIEAQLILYRELINILSNQVNTFTTINTPTGSPVVLNAAANSYTGSNLAYRTSGGNINVDDSQKIKGPDGSEVNINTKVINAMECTRSPFSAHIGYKGNRESFTAIDADYIYASASAGKDWTPSGEYASGGSKVEVTVNHGSLEGYSNKAYFDGSNYVASQEATSASGRSYSPYSTTVSFNQEASNPEGESVRSSFDATGNSKVTGYFGEVKSGHYSASSIQRAGYAKGTWVISYHEGINNNRDLVSGTFWNQGGSQEAEVVGYLDNVAAMRSNVDLSQRIDKTSGDIISVGKRAINNYDKENNKIDAEALASTYITYNAALEGYRSTAKAQNGISASAYQNVKSASGDRVILSGNAYKTNEDPDYSSPYFRYSDGMAGSITEVYGGRVRGYSNSVSVEKGGFFSWPGEYRVSSSQKVNYAEGGSIAVGTQSHENKQSYYVESRPYEGTIVGVEHANILTTVADGSIFLYSDSSEAKYPSALNIYSQTLLPLPVSGATASADLNAVGTSIEVKTNADGNSFSENVKLAATIGVKDESNRDPVITEKEKWSGLALMAIESQGAILEWGHVGVGFWNNDGTWTIGSVEGPIPWAMIPAVGWSGWKKHDLTWQEVGEGFDPKYDRIKIIKISDDHTTHPSEARKVIDGFPYHGWWPFGHTCLDAAIDVLKAYGLKSGDLPFHSAIHNVFPNNYYADIKSNPGSTYVEEYLRDYTWNTYT